MHHYSTVEDQYKEWLSTSRKNNNQYEYPNIILKPQKDDVIQIVDHW